ncbi:SDR family NAD(P)-dependent oxidoreductase [Pedobacter miscanthi]|uniref:SDR family NAD(P)-dependent oxidoreductase n=1 Tax=Pedobacter miscanthi TaxID=2259170 RepID=UPI0029310019|nr:SDR family NAD(P)-dependent oxidoreductase [Pedobacter miscanthi]
MENKKVWLITGASQGLGHTMVKYLLLKDQTVIVTTRNKSKFDQSLLKTPGLEVYELDLTCESDVKNTVADIIEKHSRIDVLINNAGYGFVGAIEEISAEEAERVIAVNVHATLRMTRLTLPHMRKRKSGHIINLSSIAGLIGSPGWGIYNASKFAVEGVSEALYHELKDLGIKVTMVEPGAIRTNFLAGSLTSSELIIEDYADTVGKRRAVLAGNNGKQPNDPEKIVIAIYGIVEMVSPPMRLLLGKDAYDRATQNLLQLKSDFEAMKHITFSTGF